MYSTGTYNVIIMYTHLLYTCTQRQSMQCKVYEVATRATADNWKAKKSASMWRHSNPFLMCLQECSERQQSMHVRTHECIVLHGTLHYSSCFCAQHNTGLSFDPQYSFFPCCLLFTRVPPACSHVILISGHLMKPQPPMVMEWACQKADPHNKITLIHWLK